MDDYTHAALREMMTALVAKGLLQQGGEYPTLSVPPQGRAFLRDRGTVHLPVPESRARSRASRRATPSAAPLDYDETLFEKLRAIRIRLARERAVPPYVIFGDRSLQEMSAYHPTTPNAFLRINGVGQKKLQDFGEQFLEVIQNYSSNAQEHERLQ